jgi:hypothetical protein
MSRFNLDRPSHVVGALLSAFKVRAAFQSLFPQNTSSPAQSLVLLLLFSLLTYYGQSQATSVRASVVIAYRSIIRSRQEMALVKLALERHRQGEVDIHSLIKIIF